MTAAVLQEVVRAVTRSIRAMGYYDADHPVFEAARREAFEALQAAWATEDGVTLGAAGGHLVIDEAGTVMNDDPSRALADRMFQASIVAVRLHLTVRPEDLGHLMRVLAERPERVRGAGGAAALLADWGAEGVEVTEVDFGAVFAGETADLSPYVGSDPVALQALRGVLRFREGRAGDADLEVRLEALDSPESLGDFLDELLDEAGPQVVAGAEGALTADDVADRAAQAFLRNQERLGGPEDLQRSAQALDAALVRLAPDARFALLRRLAGADEPSQAGQESAAKQLGGALADRTLVSALAAALVEQPDDPDVAAAVGNLIRRLRPVESRRQEILQAVDADLAGRGRPIGGALWQQMQAKALEAEDLGMLEVAVRESRVVLATHADRRRRGLDRPVPGQDVLHTLAPGILENWAVQALVSVLEADGFLKDAVLDDAERWVVDLDREGAVDEAMSVLRALVARAGRARGAPDDLEARVDRLLASERGTAWAKRLLRRDDVRGPVMGRIVLGALEQATERTAQDKLVRRLVALGPEDLRPLALERARRGSVRQVQGILRASFALGPAMGFEVARRALTHPDHGVKGHVLRDLADHPTEDVLALLAHVAGWKGSKRPAQLLALGPEDRRRLPRLQLAAVGALGLSKSPLAVRPLLELVTHTKRLADTTSDDLRVAAAQALLTNGTPAARTALDRIAQHKKKAVRELAARVLGGRR